MREFTGFPPIAGFPGADSCSEVRYMQVTLRRHAALFASVFLIFAWVLLVMVADTMLALWHSRSITVPHTALSRNILSIASGLVTLGGTRPASSEISQSWTSKVTVVFPTDATQGHAIGGAF
ncbi:MAG: hypothetical protein JF584_05145 [Acidobacteria bacterium]|nr:hypothetical protein [Acidobacteriota bacterium]